MWIVRWILGALIIIIVLGFALQNQDQTASVVIINWQSPVLPLYIYLYFAFGSGLLFWALISIFNVLKLKGSTLKLQRENKKLREELAKLRNVDIDDPVIEPAEGSLPAAGEQE